MKKAILMVSFGTSHLEQLERSILSVGESVTAAYAEQTVYNAFSSEMLREKLKKVHSKEILGVSQAFEVFEKEGYEEVTVQPLHLLGGKEYEKVKEVCKNAKASFHMRLGKPLLDEERDYRWLTAYLQSKEQDQRFLLVLGHGTTHEANSAYEKLEGYMKQVGIQGAVLTLHQLEHIEVLVEAVKKRQMHKITILPLMLVAGNHVVQEILGLEQHKWQGALMANGLEVEVITSGLGEVPEIRQLFIQHIKEAKSLK